jgi:hypothetical protein
MTENKTDNKDEKTRFFPFVDVYEASDKMMNFEMDEGSRRQTKFQSKSNFRQNS